LLYIRDQDGHRTEISFSGYQTLGLDLARIKRGSKPPAPDVLECARAKIMVRTVEFQRADLQDGVIKAQPIIAL